MAGLEDELVLTKLKGLKTKHDVQELKEEAEVIRQEKQQDEGCHVDLWQSDCRTLSTRLETMLSRGLWPDCKLAIGEKGELFQAHRVILASASSVLANMLYSQRKPHLVLPNIEPESFKLILGYIYTDSITITSCEIAYSLYEAAHFLNLPHLQKECNTFLLKNISPENVLRLYEHSEKFYLNEMKKICLEEMTDKTGEIFMSTAIEAAQIDTLEVMFSLPELNIKSELELAKAAERWVRARDKTELEISNETRTDVLGRILNFPKMYFNAEIELFKAAEQWMCKRLNIKPTMHEVDEEIDDANLLITKDCSNVGNDSKSMIRRALKNIRFLTIEPEEFAEYDMTFLLGRSELLAIMLNLNTKMYPAYMSMPAGFSACREKRNRQSKILSAEKKLLENLISQKGNDKLFSTRINMSHLSENLDNILETKTVCCKLEFPKKEVELDWNFYFNRLNTDGNNLRHCEFALTCDWKDELTNNVCLLFDAAVKISFINPRRSTTDLICSGEKRFQDCPKPQQP